MVKAVKEEDGLRSAFEDHAESSSICFILMISSLQRRHRISKTLLTEAAKIAKDLGVTIRLEPDGSIVNNLSRKTPTESHQQRSWAKGVVAQPCDPIPPCLPIENISMSDSFPPREVVTSEDKWNRRFCSGEGLGMGKPPPNPKIYHIVNVDRLASIIEKGGLLSDSEIVKLKLPGTTIGMGSIKARRLELPVECYANATVGEFVPFYFCPRSVMLYVIHCANSPELTYKGGQGPIVHLECDLIRVIAELDKGKHSWAFSRSNAGAGYTTFSKDAAQLDDLKWDHIAANRWQDSAIKNAKQAEFLVYKKFSWRFVDRIGVKNQVTFNAATNALAKATHRPTVAIEPNWYY